MTLIPCDSDCKYQKEGYCTLDSPGAVSNNMTGCVHYISLKSDKSLHSNSVKGLSDCAYTNQLDIF